MDLRFNLADHDRNDLIDRVEFLALQGRSTSWVDANHRFNRADINGDGYLNRSEFRGSKGGKLGGKPSKAAAFRLADVDGDGFLDPEEYARTLPQRQPWRGVLKKFTRLDKNSDFLISPREFGLRVAF